MKDVTTLGEVLIDFAPEGNNENGFPTFVANPGGAPSNVLVALSRLDKQTSFLGAVGKDQFGNMLENILRHNGVDTSGIVYSDTHTTLAFVHIDEDGDRSFSFCRNPGADMMLSKNDVKTDLISQSRIFHVGSISMTNEPSREATQLALEVAKNNRVVISFDPNLRESLWSSLDEAKEQITETLLFADIVKVSEEELEFLTNTRNIKIGAKQLYDNYNISVLFITVGNKGSYIYCNGILVHDSGFKVNVVDTTGCGDAFFAGVLCKLLENNLLINEIQEIKMKEILQFGNAMGAYVAQFKGGIPSLPTLQEIEKFRS